MEPKDLRITVPPEGTCAGKATLVDVSADPIGHHLREAKRLLEELVSAATKAGASDVAAADTLIEAAITLAIWETR